MDLMEILKALFGDEALTFEQFAEKVNNAADVKLGNLAGGQYVEKDKYDDVSNQLASANANLEGYDPDWQDKVKQAQTGLFSKHKILGGLLDLNCQATPVVISAGQYDKIASEHSFFVSILHYLLQIQLLKFEADCSCDIPPNLTCVIKIVYIGKGWSVNVFKIYH